MSKKYRIGYLDEDEGYQAKFYQAFKNEFDIKISGSLISIQFSEINPLLKTAFFSVLSSKKAGCESHTICLFFLENYDHCLYSRIMFFLSSKMTF